MKREAEDHAADDKERRELVDVKNQAEHLLTRQEVARHGGRSPRPRASSPRSATREQLKGDDKAAIEAAQAAQDASVELGKAEYDLASSPRAEADAPSGGTDDVIDAEYEVKDDK